MAAPPVAAHSLSFCPDCGTILDLPSVDNILCDCCGYRCKYADLNNLQVVTSSAPLAAPPAWLAAGAEKKKKADKPVHSTVEEPCPKCNNPQMLFYTMQLRSADEGSTVFYECPKCQ
jgi:DNA-directed RNA polymerase I subunit RPA12